MRRASSKVLSSCEKETISPAPSRSSEESYDAEFHNKRQRLSENTHQHRYSMQGIVRGQKQVQKSVVDLEHFNHLKKRLSKTGKANAYLQSPGNLCKGECTRLKKELDHVLIDSACKESISVFHSTPLTSISASEKPPATSYKAGKTSFRELLCKDMRNCGLP